MRATYANGRPTYLRSSVAQNHGSFDVAPGRIEVVRRGSEATVIAVGPMLDRTLEAAESLDVSVLYATSVAPFDRGTLAAVVGNHPLVIIVEPFYEGTLVPAVSEAFAHLPSRIVPRGFLVTIEVPSWATPGTHTILAIGRTSYTRAQSSFLVRADWPQFGNGPSHHGVNPYENVLSPQTVPALIADWGSEEPYPYLLSSVVARGVVYVDSWVCDPFCHSAVTAVDTGSGAAIWTRGFHQVNNYSSPTVAGGIVYIAPKHRLFALNAATGAKRWSVVLGHTDITSAAVAEGTVYVATDYGEDLSALDASSGVVLWSQWIGEDAYSTPSVSGGAVYAGTSDGVLHALNASTGAPIWTFQTGGSLGLPRRDRRGGVRRVARRQRLRGGCEDRC